MRMKRDDGRGPPQLERALDDAAHQLLMADVHAIEIAYRRDTAAREIGLAKRVLEDEHRVGGRRLTELVDRRSASGPGKYTPVAPVLLAPAARQPPPILAHPPRRPGAVFTRPRRAVA